MRKWFNNQLKQANCDLETKEFLMAHRTRESRGSYNAQGQDPEGLKEKYKNFIPFLTIEKTLDVSESEDFKRIKAEHETLLVEAEKHRIERSELQELREKDTERERKLRELGEEIEKLKSLESSRAKLQEEFEPIFEERRSLRYEVEEMFQMPFEDIYQSLNAGEDAILKEHSHISDEYLAHIERLKKDKGYAQKWREFISKNKFEKNTT